MVPVFFDLDGTLIDSLPNVQSAANAVLASYDLPALSREVVAGFVGLGEQVFVDRLIAATALECGMRGEVLSVFMARYKEVTSETRTFPGVIQALELLQARGIRLGLVTNKPRAPLIPTLEVADLVGFFDVVVAGDDLTLRKPDPMPILHAMKALETSCCIYVGDSETDAATAKNAGMPFVLFTEGIRVSPIEDLQYDASFSDFADLPELIFNLG